MSFVAPVGPEGGRSAVVLSKSRAAGSHHNRIAIRFTNRLECPGAIPSRGQVNESACSARDHGDGVRVSGEEVFRTNSTEFRRTSDGQKPEAGLEPTRTPGAVSGSEQAAIPGDFARNSLIFRISSGVHRLDFQWIASLIVAELL
jgi:hypothetical protein